MNDLDYSRAVTALEATQGQLRALNESVDGIREYGKTNRRHIKFVALALTFDIIFTLGGAWIVRTLYDNHSAFITSCQNSNVVRARDVQLWDHVLDLATATHPHPTSAQETSDARLKAYVANTFKQVDCNTLK